MFSFKPTVLNTSWLQDSVSSMQTMLAFASSNPDEQVGSNVQINFAQRDLACKQHDLEQLERDCLKRVLVEERRRFAELTTCLDPVLVCLFQFTHSFAYAKRHMFCKINLSWRPGNLSSDSQLHCLHSNSK